jgi:hypothetical protein
MTFGVVNRAFLWPEINDLNPESFAPGNTLVDITDDWDGSERGLLGTMPSGLQEALRALIFHNLQREQRLEMHFAWLPAEGWKMTVYEDDVTPGGDPERCQGAITVLLESRKPADLSA